MADGNLILNWNFRNKYKPDYPYLGDRKPVFYVVTYWACDDHQNPVQFIKLGRTTFLKRRLRAYALTVGNNNLCVVYLRTFTNAGFVDSHHDFHLTESRVDKYENAVINFLRSVLTIKQTIGDFERYRIEYKQIVMDAVNYVDKQIKNNRKLRDLPANEKYESYIGSKVLHPAKGKGTIISFKYEGKVPQLVVDYDKTNPNKRYKYGEPYSIDIAMELKEAYEKNQYKKKIIN